MQKVKWNVMFCMPFLLSLAVLLVQYSFGFPQGDDFTFSVEGGTLQNCWEYYWFYYSAAGSRMSNFLAQILLLGGLRVWQVLTPFVITGISLLLYYYASGRLTICEEHWKRDGALACCCAFFPGFIPVAHHMFGDCFMWMAGSCNYLYPFFLLMVGFVPFYQAMRERKTPKFFRVVSPVVLVLAGLLHEQIAMALAVMCAAVTFLSYRRGKRPVYLTVLTLLALLVLVYTLSCPGAYRRLDTVMDTGQGMVKSYLLKIMLYLYPLTTAYWPYTVLLGGCGLVALRGRKGGLRWLTSFFLLFGMVLAPLTQLLGLPSLQEQPLASEFFSVRFFEMVLAVYWGLYFVAVFAAFLISAWGRREKGYLAVLYLGLGASQVFPALIGSWGRPVFHFAVFTLLLALCITQEERDNTLQILRYAAAAVALCTMVYTCYPLWQNHCAYGRLEEQIQTAKTGRSNRVVIDTSQFDYGYCYSNSFSSNYRKELRAYYGLPERVEIVFQ